MAMHGSPSHLLVDARTATAGGLPAVTIRHHVPRAGRSPRVKVSCSVATGARTVDAPSESRILRREEGDADGKVFRLKSWVEEEGGYVHPALGVSFDTPSGTRGITTCQDILLTEDPVVIVPQKLYMTVPDANKRLSGRAAMARLPFHRLSGFDKLAFFLAFERRRGERSFWYPYIAALPDDNPCAWALTDSELESTIAAFDPKMVETWMPQAVESRESLLQRSEKLTTIFGRTFGSVSQDDFLWACGMIASRAFGSDKSLGLAPYIDLLNHKAGSGHPKAIEFEGRPDAKRNLSVVDRLLRTASTGSQICWAVSTAPPPYDEECAASSPVDVDGTASVGLLQGQELTINYVTNSNLSPLMTLLNMGFIPPEMLSTEHSFERSHKL